VSEILEEAVNSIEGIRSLRSASSDSLSLLWIEFELEYDIQEKAQQVREKVAAVRGELPDDVEPPVIERVDPDATPVLAVMLAAPYSIREVSEFAERRLKTRLERVAGVGSVTLVGSRPREIRVWIDPVHLAGHGLAVDDLLAAVRREHVEMPGGRIENSHTEYAVRTEGKLASAEGFAGVAVASRGGRVVHLRDVATVEDGLAEERTFSRLNGRRGVALQIRRQSGENTVRVVDAVKAELERIRPELPEGYEMMVALDASIFIRGAISDVVLALAWGAVLASLVVFAFLRNLRSTLIAAITIPASLVASFCFFYAFGFTINTMTMMALALSIGLLIDDAIVVLENGYRHMERGLPPERAASDGTDEIGTAVIATSLAICAVFVPIAFLSGVVGRFFREFGLVASCTVLTSTLIALSLTPMLCARFVRVRTREGGVYRYLEAAFRALEAHYRRLLGWAVGHRLATICGALAAVGIGIGLALGVPINFVIASDRSEFNVWLEMPLGTTLAGTQAETAQVEAMLAGIPEVEAVFTTIGAGVKKRVNEAELFVKLRHKSRREASQAELMSRVREGIESLGLPLEDWAVEEVGMIQIAGGRHADLMYSVRGPEIGRLQYLAGNLLERMRRAGGYADVYLSYEVGKPEVSLAIERARAADLGVPAARIASTVAALYAGIQATTFEDAGERYDVRIQIRPEDRDDVSKLDLVRVRSAKGELVPLRNLVTPRIGSGPVQIDRENRTRVITIYGNLEGKAAGDADVEVSAFAEQLGIASPYEFDPVGPTKRLRETSDAIRFAFALAIVAIYMILAAQFNSFVHPFTIMLSAPLSFVGAFAAIRATGQSLDVMGQIAFLMLMGIVMKNGILLVDYTNTLRARGLPLYEAVLEAGPTRMRPVLMTAISTIFGMLPLALGMGDGAEWRSPMGVIAIGGLAASTPLTLVVVPVAYTLVDDAQMALTRLARTLQVRSGFARP
jgi:HAE1 family hydrophobic/amphiphilic exporter-1